MKCEIIHKRINPADYTDDTDPREAELLKWFRMMPVTLQDDLIEEAQLIGYANMICMMNDKERNNG